MKKRIGYTCGVYDLFHVGHLNHLEKCKEKCDYLIVGVCDDDYVLKVKNKKAVINENDRLRIIKALKCVDEAHIVDVATTIDKVIAHKKFNFNVLFAGSDWKGTERFNETERAFKELYLDIETVFLPYTQGVSSTELRKEVERK